MQIGLAVFAIISLAFLSASGGLAPEQFSVANADESRFSTEQSASVVVSQQTTQNQPLSSRPVAPVVEEVIADYQTPIVESFSVRNIEDDSALVRAAVNMHDYKGGTVYVVYGYSQSRVQDLARSGTVLDRNTHVQDDRARVVFIDLNPRGEELYEKRINRLVSNADYYHQVCLQYTDLAQKSARVCADMERFSTNPEVSLNNRFQVPRISADRAMYVTDGEASINVNLQMNDGVDGIPFLVYGQLREFVDEIDERYTAYSQVDEFDEDLQKKRLGVGRLGQSEFSVQLDDLEDGAQYYYRACVQYDGEKDGLLCGSTRSFETDSRDKSSKPTLQTNAALSESGKATLSGSIRMGDFNDGYAFFIYGTNLEKVQEVAEANSFTRIRQSVDELQKIGVDDDVDGRDSFRMRISDLEFGQVYYYRLCVQYVDEDKYGREQFFINCGGVRSWVSL